MAGCGGARCQTIRGSDLTDAATFHRDTRDGFWVRVRQALSGRAGAPGRSAPPPQPIGGFEAELARGWNIAREYYGPLTLVLVEIDCLSEYFAAYGPDATEDCCSAVQQCLAGALTHPEQGCVTLGDGRFGVILPELPPHVARRLASTMAQAVRRMGRAHKASHAGTITVSMGLSLTLPQEADAGRLLEAAQVALRRAQKRGLGRIEMVDLRPRQDRYAA